MVNVKKGDFAKSEVSLIADSQLQIRQRFVLGKLNFVTKG
jgi:hypothetical protein